MTLDQIDAFLAINEQGNFTKAAQAIHVTTTTLSYRITELEKELGFRLYNRGKGIREASLTSQGLSFLPLAEQWRRIWQGAVSISRQGVRRELRMSVVHSLHAPLMPEVVQRFTNRGLPVDLFLMATNSNDAFQSVTQGSVDVAILNSVGTSHVVDCVLLAREDILVVSDPTSGFAETVAVSDLNPAKEVAINWNPMTPIWRDRWFGPEQSSRVRIESTSLLPSLLRGIGPGAWALAAHSIACQLAESDGLRVSVPDPAELSREVWLATGSGVDSECRDALREDLRAVLGQMDRMQLVD